MAKRIIVQEGETRGNWRRADRALKVNRISLRTVGWLLALGLGLALVFSPHVQALAWLNYAQAQRFNGDPGRAANAFAQALVLDPGNPQIRWQAGENLAYAGDAKDAWVMLRPLEEQQTLDRGLARLMLATLFAAGQGDEALQLYRRLLDASDEPSLPPGIAVRLANRYLTSNTEMPPAVTNSLMAQALGLNPSLPEYSVYEKEFTSGDFWATDFGKRARAAFLWLSTSNSGATGATGATSPAELPTQEVTAQANSERVAALLGVAPSSVRLGPELVTNGDFEQHDLVDDKPVGWQPIYNNSGGIWNLAAFAMGADSQAFAGRQSLHIEGLRIEQLPGKEGARAGFQQAPIVLQPAMPYMISFVYRTENTEASETALWLTFDPQVVYPFDKRFPPTHGEWRRVTLVGWNRSGKEATIAPLLRLWSEGSAWFDDFSIRPVLSAAPLQPQDVIVSIENVSGNNK